MKKWLSAAFLALFVFGAVMLASAAAKDAAAVEVNGNVLASVRPDLDTPVVELSFQEVTNGSAHIRLNSPEADFYSPTDFPWVEGTPLIDSTVTIKDGRAAFEYMFPIRGEYAMTLDILDEAGQAVGTQELTINIHENPNEVRNAVLFISLLAAFGLLCGWIFSKRRRRLGCGLVELQV
ncbi:hypothetical protein KP806_21610 [Paenibacillus sp. N4]|uniref:hypothetical protein n=1 Tax=Paenibacillus vietnamensis TaxID=2590547 RepID=UPI001CD1878D|nr:hypothetical protein [Paenibacillus vietnamensis]MCA0757664.1 hypothetical protein [Paenibacillus vietnamensis]